MALNKTDYGLIYNDDGSLCVTIRKDDVPFEGVASFAVEEGTTNKHATEGQCAQDWTKWSHWGSRTYWSSESQYDDPVMGKVFVGINAHSDSAILYDYWPYSVEAGKTYTMSIYLKADQAWTGNLKLYVAKSDWTNIASIHQTATVTTTWKRFTATFTASMSATDVGFGWQLFGFPVGAKLYAALPQFEEKPFATSFVDGTRPDGRLKFTMPIISDFVIQEWVKHPPLTAVAFVFAWGSDVQNKIAIRRLVDGSFDIEHRKNGVSQFSSKTAVYPWNEWLHLVLIKTGLEVKLYVNGTLATQMTLNEDVGNYNSIWFQNPGVLNFNNGLIANLLISAYDPAIWTDEYIKTLYQARRPFAVPPKIPII